MSVADHGVLAVPANGAADESTMRDWAGLLVARARTEGVELARGGELLAGLVRRVLRTGLEVEMAEHLGYGRHDRSGAGPRTRATARRPSGSGPRLAGSTCGCGEIGPGPWSR